MKRLMYKNKKSFSLIEVMIVCALVLTIAGLAIVQLGFIDRFLVRAQAEQLATLFHYLHHKAMLDRTDYCIDFDPQKNRYEYTDAIVTLPSMVSFGVPSEVLGPPSAPERVIENPITFDQNRLCFYPNGAVQAGTIYLVDKNKSTCYAISSSISTTGYFRIYHYYDKKWHQLRSI